MKRLRVGFVCAGWSPDPGGIETVTRELAGELMRRRHDVTALALGGRGHLKDGEQHESRVEGVRVRRVGWSHGADSTLADLARTPELEACVLGWVRDHELDLVHLHHLSGWGLGVPARLNELGVPVVWTLHDYWALCPRGQMLHVDGHACTLAEPASCGECAARTWPLLARGSADVEALAGRLEFARAALAACSRVYAPSRAVLEVLSRHGLSTATTVLCENGLVPRVRVQLRPVEKPVRVGVLGAVQPSKGVLELAQWITRLEGFELHVHGPLDAYHGDPSYAEALEELARGERSVVLHGPYAARALDEVLGGLDLVAVPSRWEEVHGLAAREARAAGLPVFASEVGGLAEGDFVLLPRDDREAWCAALYRFARDEAWRRSLLESAARPRSMSEMADQLERDYAELVLGGLSSFTS